MGLKPEKLDKIILDVEHDGKGIRSAEIGGHTTHEKGIAKELLDVLLRVLGKSPDYDNGPHR